MPDMDFEIGLTEAGLASLQSLGLPHPDKVVYVPADEEVQRGDGTWQRAGFATLTWTFTGMAERQLFRALRHLFTTETGASVTVYVRSDIPDGWYFGPRAVRLFTAEFKRPFLGGRDGGGPAEGFRTAYDDVVFQFTILSEVSEGSV